MRGPHEWGEDTFQCKEGPQHSKDSEPKDTRETERLNVRMGTRRRIGTRLQDQVNSCAGLSAAPRVVGRRQHSSQDFSFTNPLLHPTLFVLQKREGRGTNEQGVKVQSAH